MKYTFFWGGLLLLHSCSNVDLALKVKGSDTEVNLSVSLAEAFHSQHQNVLVSISGGGSGLGIASLLNGNADLANSSRKIKEEELSLFKDRNIQLDSFIFAQDAVAFVVSDKTPIDSISVLELSKILSGEQNNWFFLTKRKMPINIYGRQSNSGTYEYVKHKLNIHFSPYAKQMNGNAQILEALKSDNSGIGYVGAGYIIGDNIKGLKVLKIFNGIDPAISPFDAEKIRIGKYFFQRPLYQYFKKKDYYKVKSFLDFEKSTEGQQIIKSSGYYPILHD